MKAKRFLLLDECHVASVCKYLCLLCVLYRFLDIFLSDAVQI